MKKKDLFRTEALRANEKKLLGEIILVRPLSFTFLTVLAIGVASILIGVSIVGTYTKRIALNGQLVPDSGMIKV